MIVPNLDLRNAFRPPRDQGPRSACLSFAVSSVHEHAGRHPQDLSVEYLHYHAIARTPGSDPSRGSLMVAAAEALTSDGQPPESDWPYEALQRFPSDWRPPATVSAIYRATATVGTLTCQEVITQLDLSHAIALGLVVTDAFRRADANGMLPILTPGSIPGAAMPSWRSVTAATPKAGAAAPASRHSGYSSVDRPRLRRDWRSVEPRLSDLSRATGIHRADLSKALPLAFLAPAIIEDILSGRQPVNLTARRLVRLTDFPVSWHEQQALLGL